MEGGGVATDSLDLADDLRSIRSHGWSRDRTDIRDWNAGSTSTDQKFLFVTTGFNIRPMEIQAAIGKMQLADIDLFIERRRSIAIKIRDFLKDTRFELMDGGSLSGTDEESAHYWRSKLLAHRLSCCGNQFSKD
jgi:CDP-6-deoxy-D-xylo-4-hexulose-3-dehydrase